MPISRVMNTPTGGTPVPPIGGGDVNGTMARSNLGGQAGTGGHQLNVPRHFHAQTSFTGIPSVAVALAGEGESAPIALEEAGEIEPILQAEESDGPTEPASGSASVRHAARNERPRRRRRFIPDHQRWFAERKHKRS